MFPLLFALSAVTFVTAAPTCGQTRFTFAGQVAIFKTTNLFVSFYVHSDNPLEFRVKVSVPHPNSELVVQLPKKMRSTEYDGDTFENGVFWTINTSIPRYLPLYHRDHWSLLSAFDYEHVYDTQFAALRILFKEKDIISNTVVDQKMIVLEQNNSVTNPNPARSFVDGDRLFCTVCDIDEVDREAIKNVSVSVVRR